MPPRLANHRTSGETCRLSATAAEIARKANRGHCSLLRLALPVLAGHLLDTMVGFTDTWLTGNYLATAEHLAAMNLTGYLLWFMVSMFSLVSIGTTAMGWCGLSGRGIGPPARHTTNQAFAYGCSSAAFWWRSHRRWGSLSGVCWNWTARCELTMLYL